MQKKVKVGVIGAGHLCKHHIKHLSKHPLVEFVGFFDLDDFFLEDFFLDFEDFFFWDCSAEFARTYPISDNGGIPIRARYKSSRVNSFMKATSRITAGIYANSPICKE